MGGGRLVISCMWVWYFCGCSPHFLLLAFCCSRFFVCFGMVFTNACTCVQLMRCGLDVSARTVYMCVCIWGWRRQRRRRWLYTRCRRRRRGGVCAPMFGGEMGLCNSCAPIAPTIASVCVEHDAHTRLVHTAHTCTRAKRSEILLYCIRVQVRESLIFFAVYVCVCLRLCGRM